MSYTGKGENTPLHCFRGIEEANADDVYPKNLKESNQLYGKFWLQGVHAITGKRHQDTKDCWAKNPEDDEQTNSFWIKCTDPFFNFLIQLLVQHQSKFCDFLMHRPVKEDEITEDTHGHLGIPDFFNPLYLATVFLVCLSAELYNTATGKKGTVLEALFEQAKGKKHISFGQGLAVVGSILLAPITAAVMLATLLTTYLWDLAKVAVAVTTVTLSSAIWYPIKLKQLHDNDDGAGAGAANDELDDTDKHPRITILS